MTTVLFYFNHPNGDPYADAKFSVTLRKAGFNPAHELGIVVPEIMQGVTDADGKATLSLAPIGTPYFLELRKPGADIDDCAAVHYRFMVPDSPVPISIENLIVTDPTWSKPWDEQALEIIIQAVADSKAAADSADLDAQAAHASALAAAGSAGAASASESNALNSAAQASAASAVAVSASNDARELLESGNLPSISGENAHYMNLGDTTEGWDAYIGTTVAQGAGFISINKTYGVGTSAGAYVPIKNPAGTDLILYGKTASSAGAVVWLLNTDGYKQAAVWFGTATADANLTPGAISLRAAQPSGDDAVKQVPGVFDYGNPIEYALHIDTRFNTLNFWYKASGVWVFGASIPYTRGSFTHVGTAFGNNAVQGAQINIYHLMVCYPNIVVYGDSISTGAVGFDPNPATGWSDSASLWTTYAGLYPMLKNNLPVLKGTGGWSSYSYLANVATVTATKAKVSFMHASSNDFGSSVPMNTRTEMMQGTIDAMNLAGIQVVLLNALPGTPAHVSNSMGLMRDYCHAWWSNYRHQLKGVGQMLDIARVIEGVDGYQDAALTVADGIHPNVAGYRKIGERMRWFFSQAVIVDKPGQPSSLTLTSLASQVGQANRLLMFTGANAVGQTYIAEFAKNSILPAADAATLRATLSLPLQANAYDRTANCVLRNGSHGIGGVGIPSGDYAGLPALALDAGKGGGIYSYYDVGRLPVATFNALEATWGYDAVQISQLVMSVVDNEMYFRGCAVANTAVAPFSRVLTAKNVALPVTADFNVSGGIMEMGQNANGTYFKFYNRLLINIVQFVGYTAGTTVTKYWPHQYAPLTYPTVSANIIPQEGWNDKYVVFGVETSAQFHSFDMTHPTNTVNIVGVGRW